MSARAPVQRCGTYLGKTAVGPLWSLRCYAPHRDVIGIVAPPQTTKTVFLQSTIIDHDGSVVSTSTKPDIYTKTAALRARRSRSGRVELFNPEGLAGYPSTFRWSPLMGCEVPTEASKRAAALVNAADKSEDDNNGWFRERATVCLAALLLAAAIGGKTMDDVSMWAVDLKAMRDNAVGLLFVHHDKLPLGTAERWAAELLSLVATKAEKSRDGILMTMQSAVRFMADPTVAPICRPTDEDPNFDVRRFLEDYGTVYIVGADEEESTVAPLLAALAGYIFDSAKRIATMYPEERLDPPLLAALDEVALISIGNLDRWTADSGGRGIHVVWAVQSLSQLAQQWGELGADTIWNNTNVKLIAGGLTIADNLEDISKLCGEVLRDAPSGEGKEWVRLLPVDKLRELPPFHALLVHRNTRVTIVRIQKTWLRPDVLLAGPPPVIPPMRELEALMAP